jgi:hypothetical protein
MLECSNDAMGQDLAVTGVQAADLPVDAKPVEYLRRRVLVCLRRISRQTIAHRQTIEPDCRSTRLTDTPGQSGKQSRELTGSPEFETPTPRSANQAS